MMKSTESFLPNINMRPNSRRKINIPARDTGPTNSMLREKSNKALEEVVAKVESEKESKEQKSVPVAVSQIGTKPGTSGAKILVKRGLSKSRKPQ